LAIDCSPGQLKSSPLPSEAERAGWRHGACLDRGTA
jgi:hypothetical protein